jgi:hypothetical protein
METESDRARRATLLRRIVDDYEQLVLEFISLGWKRPASSPMLVSRSRRAPSPEGAGFFLTTRALILPHRANPAGWNSWEPQVE